MSDAPALLRLSAPPAAPPIRHDDDAVAIGRGLVNGVLLALPLWALIGFAAVALL